MAKFIDYHAPMGQMSPEAMEKGTQMLQQMAKDIKAKKADRFGVTPINVFMGTTGESWCLTEAPNVDAVLKSHEANGAKLSRKDVVEVTPLV